MVETGRTALVTGGGSGMARATALRLARKSRPVGVLDFGPKVAETVAAEIAAAGGKATALVADVSNSLAAERAVERPRDAFGPETILINNVSVENFTPFAEIAEDAWDRLMAVNLQEAASSADGLQPSAGQLWEKRP